MKGKEVSLITFVVILTLSLIMHTAVIGALAAKDSQSGSNNGQSPPSGAGSSFGGSDKGNPAEMLPSNKPTQPSTDALTQPPDTGTATPPPPPTSPIPSTPPTETLISPPPIVASPENLTQPTNIPQVIPATPIPTDNNTGQPIPQSNETTPPPPPSPTTTPPTTPPTTIINNTATAIAISNTVYNIKVEITVRQVVAGSVQSAATGQQPSFLMLLDTGQICQIAGDTACVLQQQNFKVKNIFTKFVPNQWQISGWAQFLDTRAAVRNIQLTASFYDQNGNNVGGAVVGNLSPSSLRALQLGSFQLSSDVSKMTAKPTFFRLQFTSTP